MPVLSVDFDGTIVEHRFPKIGKPLPHAFEVLRDLKKAGFKLILWTCRENYEGDKYLQDAVDFCKKNGVEFDAVNETIEDHEFRPPDCVKRKPHASLHIDDRNLGGFPGWETVRAVLLDGKTAAWDVAA